MDKILIITDTAKIKLEKIFINNEQDNKYYIHSINTDTESIIKLIHKHNKNKKIKIAGISNSEFSLLAEKEAREYYLKLIRDLPSKILIKNEPFKKVFTINNRNYWWYLPISEKNIWKNLIN